MATDRSPYVAIADSLLDEPWPDALKLLLVKLSCHMHSRWRSDRRLTMEEVAAHHTISRHDLLKITGRFHMRSALNSLRSLADLVTISVKSEGDLTIISWPKWAKYNGTHSRSPEPHGARDEPLRNRNRNRRRNSSKDLLFPAAPEPSKPSKPARSQCPENPSPEQWRRIREWRDAKHPDFTDAELEAQWERHANYHIGKGTLALDWARSFYNWLTGPYYKPATTSGLARAKPEIETFDEAASRRNREWLLSLGGGK